MADVRRKTLPKADRGDDAVAGHWLLARLGKRVLRPGGAELTRELLNRAEVTDADVLELAPGLSRTATEILARRPRSYLWGWAGVVAHYGQISCALLDQGVDECRGHAGHTETAYQNRGAVFDTVDGGCGRVGDDNGHVRRFPSLASTSAVRPGCSAGTR